MAKLSEKRRQAIYDAVYTQVIDLRIKMGKQILRNHPLKSGVLPADAVDAELFYLSQRVSEAAIRAAEGKP